MDCSSGRMEPEVAPQGLDQDLKQQVAAQTFRKKSFRSRLKALMTKTTSRKTNFLAHCTVGEVIVLRDVGPGMIQKSTITWPRPLLEARGPSTMLG